MDEASIETARRTLGEIVDKARLAEQYTIITRQNKEAAAVVSVRFLYAVIDYLAVTMDAEGRSAPEVEWYHVSNAIREGRRRLGLLPGDPRVAHHIDGNPRNNDPANLRIMDPKENGDATADR
jgi:prevent-host-death family protein